jgi:hypothetical protein
MCIVYRCISLLYYNNYFDVYIFIIDINSSSHTFLYGYRVTTFKASQTYLDKRLIYKVWLKSSYNKLRLGIRPKFALVTGGLYELGR